MDAPWVKTTVTVSIFIADDYHWFSLISITIVGNSDAFHWNFSWTRAVTMLRKTRIFLVVLIKHWIHRVTVVTKKSRKFGLFKPPTNLTQRSLVVFLCLTIESIGNPWNISIYCLFFPKTHMFSCSVPKEKQMKKKRSSGESAFQLFSHHCSGKALKTLFLVR